MSDVYSWRSDDIDPVVAIISATLGFAAFWFISGSEKIKKFYFHKYKGDKAWENYFVFQKLTGVVFLGLLPGIAAFVLLPYGWSDYGVQPGNYMLSLGYILIMGILMLFVNYRSARSVENYNMYPQMRIMQWNTTRIFKNTWAWMAYLFAYEFLFRGILFIPCVHAFGFWPATAINVALYTATHIPKSMKETIGAFPYGLLLCYITVETSSILVAFLTHVILALSNDYFSVHHNPEMKFV